MSSSIVGQGRAHPGQVRLPRLRQLAALHEGPRRLLPGELPLPEMLSGEDRRGLGPGRGRRRLRHGPGLRRQADRNPARQELGAF